MGVVHVWSDGLARYGRGRFSTIRQDPVIAFAHRRRSVKAKLVCVLALQGRARRRDSPALAYQQRTTQNWVNVSRLSRAATDTAQRVPLG